MCFSLKLVFPTNLADTNLGIHSCALKNDLFLLNLRKNIKSRYEYYKRNSGQSERTAWSNCSRYTRNVFSWLQAISDYLLPYVERHSFQSLLKQSYIPLSNPQISWNIIRIELPVSILYLQKSEWNIPKFMYLKSTKI